MNKQLSIIAQFTFIVMAVKGILGNYDVETIYLTLFVNCLILFLLFAVHFSGKVFLLLFIGSLFLFHNKDTLALVDLASFVYILRKEKLNRYAGLGLIIYTLMFIAILFLLSFGIVQSEELNYNYKGNVVANTMGMANPNVAAQFFYFIFIFTFLRADTMKYSLKCLMSILVILLSFLIFQYTQARGVFVSTVLLSVLTVLLPLIKKFPNTNRLLLSLAPLILAVTSLFIALNSESYEDLNEVATNRVSNPAIIFAMMNPIDWIIGVKIPDMAMDSSYLTILFEGGLIVFLGIFSTMQICIWRNYVAILPFEPVILSILAYGCLENIFSSFNCVSVLFFSVIIYSKCLNSRTTSYGNTKGKSVRPNIMHASAR